MPSATGSPRPPRHRRRPLRSRRARRAPGCRGAAGCLPCSKARSTLLRCPRAAARFVADHVTAVGDSITIDAQGDMETDIPGVNVQAGVSRQWYQGEDILQQLKSDGQLGAVVVVGLSTNGPITTADFSSMMSILSGASRVVFVNIVVGQSWQNANNAVLAAGVAQYPRPSWPTGRRSRRRTRDGSTPTAPTCRSAGLGPRRWPHWWPARSDSDLRSDGLRPTARDPGPGTPAIGGTGSVV